MTLTKNDVVDQLQSELGFSRIRSVQLIETLLEMIKTTLESGDDLMISGFGKFCVKSKHQRKDVIRRQGRMII